MRKIMAVFTATTLGTLAFASTTLNSPAQAAFYPRKITVVTTGDLLLHERMWNTAIADGENGQWDFFPQLSGIGKIIKGADLALCHQETPLAPLGGHYTGYPVFNSPPQIVSAIKRLGFDMCDQTSNHSFDGGEAGVKRTIKEFDKAGIAHTGTYATPADSKKPLVMTVNSSTGTIKVGICAFTYGFNGFPYPNGHTWLANQTSFLKVMQGVKAVRDAGAEVVIVKLHWGTEYANYPNDNQQLLAKKIAKTGLVDLIDGDHTHSVEPMQKIGRMWVAYSHGNLVAAQPDPESIQYEGLISRWTFTEQSNHRFQVTRAEYAPTLISRHVPVRVIDVERALATGKWTGVTKSRLDKAMARTSKTILSMNAPAKLIAQ
jgi:poly-gamma-glutamate synthesis protein (capsule biosynthesis protein)